MASPLFGGIDVPTSTNGTIGNVVNEVAASAVGTIQSQTTKLTGALQEKLFNTLGPKLGSGLQTTTQNSWYSKGAARNDPHLHIDWTVEMPGGFPPEYIESVQAPVLEFGAGGGVFRGGQFIYIPEQGDIGTLSLTFYEDNVFTASQFLTSWRNSVSLNGVFNYPSAYKKTIRVHALDATGALVCTFDYHGCWPQKSQGSYNFGSDSTERTHITQEFPVDYMSITFPGQVDSPDPFGFSNLANFLSGAPIATLSSAARGLAGQLSSTIAGAVSF